MGGEFFFSLEYWVMVIYCLLLLWLLGFYVFGWIVFFEIINVRDILVEVAVAGVGGGYGFFFICFYVLVDGN